MTGGIRPGPLGSGAIVLFALGLAASALAATLTQVTADAEALLIVYEDLEDRIDACTGGTCGEAQEILEDLDAAELDRAKLHQDRDSLEPCGNCGSVDLTIGDIDVLAGELLAGTGDWEEEAQPGSSWPKPSTSPEATSRAVARSSVPPSSRAAMDRGGAGRSVHRGSERSGNSAEGQRTAVARR